MKKGNGLNDWRSRGLAWFSVELHVESIDIYADFARSMLEDFANDKESRDGIDHDLFPLTSKEQRKYEFHLEGTEDYRGTPMGPGRERFDEGLWFPVTYGGEFKLKALFLYSRRIGISMQNSGFQHAVVESKVKFSGIPWLLNSFVP